MCAYQSAKKHFTRDEIIEILKKNVDLYKNESNFPSYIVDLALYLVEFGYKREAEQPVPTEKSINHQTGAKSQKVYKVFRAPSTGDTSKFCPFCGAPLTSDKGKCYQCGNVI
jgi:hypothetical protein